MGERVVALFVEDHTHKAIIGALVQRLAGEYGIPVRLDWRSAIRGHGRVVEEFKTYLRDLGKQSSQPDVIVVATDANCHGLNGRVKEIGNPQTPAPLVLAVPDPHVERWLLLDGAAFKTVFGRGCAAPDKKCSRDLYKQRLIEAIDAAGTPPNFGGVEFAEDIVHHMDIKRAGRADRSLQRFVDGMRNVFRQWRT